MTTQMDETFATALRAGLVDRVNRNGAARRQRRHRRIAGWTFAGLVVAGGGTAVATTVLIGPPGGDVVSRLGSAATVTATGTQTVDLGAPPPTANRVELHLTCLTPGRFTFADGASVACSASDVGTPSATSGYSLPLEDGQRTTLIRADAGQRWRLVAGYAHVTTSAWGTNSHGQTYGVANGQGTPDLIAIIATNGKAGYVYATRLAQASGGDPTSPEEAVNEQAHRHDVSIPVYTSDGQTVVGAFVVKGATR